MIPAEVYELCRNGKSVSGELALNPSEAPSAAAKRLFGVNIEDDHSEKKPKSMMNNTPDLQQALECGNFGNSRPSELFLTIYHDVLCTLEKNPLIGMCSPSLIGSTGVCPLTVIATIPDICRHMSNVIARAEQEVFLATNFWMFSEPSRLITNALRELSKKAAMENRRVVVKVIYDRGNMKQVINNHQPVAAKDYADDKGAVRLPHPDEIPNLDMEVVNYHRPIFGTFHSKYMVVDRKIAIIQSNNIQDNDNMEMMTHIEGPIVDSFYDVALLSWHNAMKPPLPCMNRPAAAAGTLPTFDSNSHATLFDEHGNLKLVQQSASAMPNGNDNLRDIAAHGSQLDLAQHTSKYPHYDENIAGEVLRAVSTLNPTGNETRINAITRLLNTTIQPDTKGSAPDIQDADKMTPLIPIRRHEPFPIAMVCRKPWGAPNKLSVYVPQNEAFSSALRNARRDVFIQTPNLNAEALLPEILAACRRGIHVTYYYCLGYNDAGELLPFQGGHNEMIAHGLFRDLEPQYHNNLDIYNYIAKDQVHPIHNKFKKRSCHIKLLIADGHIGIQGNGNQDTQSWYHSQEVNMMIDSELVVGKWMEGIKQNQNTHLFGKVQKEGPHAGCWTDPQTGNLSDGAIGTDPGKFAWAKGVIGAVQRVRGAGGF